MHPMYDVDMVIPSQSACSVPLQQIEFIIDQVYFKTMGSLLKMRHDAQEQCLSKAQRFAKPVSLYTCRLLKQNMPYIS